MVPFELIYDERLRIQRPLLHVEYESLTPMLQSEFELLCQQVCAQIPEEIKRFEVEYLQVFDQLKDVDDEQQFLMLNEKMNDISSRICDLNLLFLHIEGTFIAYSVHA